LDSAKNCQVRGQTIAPTGSLVDDAKRRNQLYNTEMNAAKGAANILLIDDDRELGKMLSDFLGADNLHITVRNNGESGLEEFSRNKFDLIILDIMMPGISGLDVLKRIRLKSAVPVIMLTARGDDIDRIIGLEIGADDYLPKPFNPRELLARIKAILRRSQASKSPSQILSLGNITLDTRTHRAMVNDAELELTGTEFELLKCLLETPGEVVNKEHLCERALGRRLLPYDRSVDTHISNLRGKLERAGNKDETIQNQRGVGYLLIPGS